MRAAPPVPAAIATIGPAEVRPPKCKTCNARPRIGSVAGKRVNASRTFNAVEVIVSVAEEDGAVVEAAAGSEVDDDN